MIAFKSAFPFFTCPLPRDALKYLYQFPLQEALLMLTDREEKLIVRYCRRPRIAITAIIMALALGVPFILL